MKPTLRQPLLFVALTLAILLALFLPSSHSAASSRVQITILGTTDLHGNLYPIDYYTDKPDNRGLAKIATVIKRTRKANENVVLIDSGDTIQGTPLESYHNKKINKPPDPMMPAMNALQYDAMTVEGCARAFSEILSAIPAGKVFGGAGR